MNDLALSSAKLAEVRTLTRLEQARYHQGQIDAIEEWGKKALGRLMVHVEEVVANEFWKELGYKTKNDWLSWGTPSGRTYAYMALEYGREMPDVPREALCAMPAGNIKLLADVPVKERDEQLIELAQKESVKEFRKHLHLTKPHLHIEEETVEIFHPTTTEKAENERILARVMEAEVCSRSRALNLALVDFDKGYHPEKEVAE